MSGESTPGRSPLSMLRRGWAGQDYLLVAAVAATYLYIFVRVHWRNGDEGDMLNGALAVAEGRVPYRDFYDLRPPGSFYWLGSFFTLFGATWRVARMHLLLTGTGISLLVFHLARRALGRLEAFLLCALVTAVSIPFWPSSHHHWDSNLFALMAATAFFYWHDRGGSRWLFASGILAGLTSCFIYQKGFLLLASFLAVAAIARLCFRVPIKWVTSACTMLAGYGAVGLAVLAWFSHLGALQDVVDATIRLPVNTYVDANRVPYAYHLMAHALSGLPWWNTYPPAVAGAGALLLMPPFLLISALPFLVVVVAAVCLLTRPVAMTFQLPIIAYGLIGFALWFSEFHRLDMMHLIYGCPLLLVALWLLWDAADLPRILRILAPSTLCVSLLLVAVNHGWRAATADEHIVTRRGTIVMPTDDPALRFLLSSEVSRGDYVFVYPYYPTYYFLADVKNPTRFGVLMYGPAAKPYFDEAIAALEAKKVKYILWDTMMDGENLKEWFPAYQHPPEPERWMERYFQTHYEQQALLNGFRILRRRGGERP